MNDDQEEFKRLIRKGLKEAVKRFYAKAKEFDLHILTPQDGYGIIYEWDSKRKPGRDLEYLELTKPKLQGRTDMYSTFFLKNTVTKLVDESKLQEAKDSQEWEHTTIFRYIPPGPDRFLKDYGIMRYEFYPQVYYINPSRDANSNKNCYLQKYKLSDMVSGNTFDAFKDLYNFSKL
jgi:hypothetical protein